MPVPISYAIDIIYIEVAIDTGTQVATRAIKYLFPPMNYNYTTSWYIVIDGM